MDETTDAFYKLMKSVDGVLNLVVYDEEELDVSSKFPDANIQYIKNFKQPFRALPRTNDIVVFKDLFFISIRNQKSYT